MLETVGAGFSDCVRNVVAIEHVIEHRNITAKKTLLTYKRIESYSEQGKKKPKEQKFK